MNLFGTDLLAGILRADPDNAPEVDALTLSLGKTITHVQIIGDETLRFDFEDGPSVTMVDEHSCCEHRYMTTDDNLEEMSGAILRDVTCAQGPDVVVEGDFHESAFLRIQTSKGEFVICTHNEHNGYYGGFNLSVKSE
jgi:hypothetical protein